METVPDDIISESEISVSNDYYFVDRPPLVRRSPYGIKSLFYSFISFVFVLFLLSPEIPSPSRVVSLLFNQLHTTTKESGRSVGRSVLSLVLCEKAFRVSVICDTNNSPRVYSLRFEPAAAPLTSP